MAQEATIKINLEEGNSGATLKDLKNDVKAVGQEADKTNDKFKQGQDETAKSTISLKTQLKNLKDEMVQLDHNSPEFRQMAMDAGAMEDKIKDVDAQVRILSSDTKGLDALVGAGQAIGGAFQASQGALALFGSESEEVQKAIQNVIAVQGVMNGVMAVSNAIRKESVVGQKLLIVWQHVATAAQWLWNAAMMANPIGLVILLLAGLVAGIVLLVKNIDKAIDFFSDMTNVLLVLLGPIGWMILAYQALTDETESLEDATIRLTKEEKTRHLEKVKQIKKELEDFANAEKVKQDGFDRDIKRAKAEGKSVFALELQKLESIKNVQEKQLESYNLILEAGIEHYKNQAKINGISEEEFIAQAKKQGVDLLAIQQSAIDGQQKYKDAIFDAESDILALKRDHREKNSQEDNKATDKKVENKEAETQRLIEVERKQKELLLAEKEKIENEFLDSQLSAQDQELNAVQDKYFRLIEMAQQYGEDTSILEEARQTQLDEINTKFEEQRAEKQIEIDALAEAKRISDIEKIEEQAGMVIDSANEVLNIVSSLQELGNKQEIDRIKEKQKAGEKLSKAERARLIQDEKQKRAIAVAEIAIDTAKAIAGAVSAGSSLPYPANIPAIISGVGAVLANVATAYKTLNAPLPSFDSGGGSDVAGSLGGDSQQNAPSINTNTNGSTILNEEPTRVVVLESDITNTQNEVQSIVEQATI